MEPTDEADTGTWAWVELHGGPMDGEQAWCRTDGDDPGTALISERGTYLGGRSWYAPDADGIWRWEGDSP
jgi:hypothetical protein